MRPRWNVVIFLTYAIVAAVGFVSIAFVLAAFYPMSGAAMIAIAVGAVREPFQVGTMVLFLSAVSAALAWSVLFLLGRDGVHRLEWVALLPRNYGGRSPFETSSK